MQVKSLVEWTHCPQVVIRGFMAADEELQKERETTGALQPPPGQAAAGAANMGLARNSASRVRLL